MDIVNRYDQIGGLPVDRCFLIDKGTAAALLALSVLAMAGRVQQDAAFEDTAVVVAESVEVLSGPGQQYIAEFTLHGGAEADLVETRGNWSRISIPAADLQGWVPSSAVEQIVPPTS